MSTLIVCLRSRLVSEAVAELVAARRGLDTTVAVADDVESTVESCPDVAGIVVDATSARSIQGRVGCPVLVIGRREEDRGQLEKVVAGLPPEVGSTELLEAIDAMLSGDVRPVSAPARVVDRGRRATDGIELLTARELEVLELISAASSPAEIASALDVSENTVRTHVQNLLGKLGASSKVDAVARARSLGLLESGRSR